MSEQTPEKTQKVKTPVAGGSKMEKLVALCKRRGFIFQSSEIYGGINGFWDYGPLGVELKRNLKEAWWQDIVRCPALGPDGQPLEMVGLDCTIIMNPKVWVASGHVGGFSDPMVADRVVHGFRCRADKAWVVVLFSEEDNKRFVQDREAFVAHFAHAGFVPAPSSALPQGVTISTPPDVPESFQGVPTDRHIIEHIGHQSIRDVLEMGPAASSYGMQARQALLQVVLGKLNPVVRAVEADSEGKAIEIAIQSLSGRDKKRLANLHHAAARTQLELHGAGLRSWPVERFRGLSPATQEDTLIEPRQFNLMFETFVGAVRDEESKAYLRPETAQGIFANFRNVTDTSRVRVPFGIAQQGKAFRNEVTPRNYTFRSREFEQMEIEFFIRPPEACQAGDLTPVDWYRFWRDARFKWWQSIGLTSSHLQLREHEKDELAHYAKEGAGTSDIEYKFPFTDPGYGELEGVAHRADFDLRQHAQHSGLGDNLKYFDQELQVKLQGQGLAKEEIAKKCKYFPHVIEPSAGADRGTLALLCEAYTDDPGRPSGVVMKFHPRMAPIKAAIFPLVDKDGMPEIAQKIYEDLRKTWAVQIDVKQNIGKRYARMDEAGTPFCFTVDTQTLADQTVTVRYRDTLQQERVHVDKVRSFLADKIGVL